MQLIKRVIQQSKDRALAKFSALSNAMVRDADEALVVAVSEARSGLDQRNLTASLQFLRQESGYFRSRFESLYREGVERALKTMYKDLRQGLQDLSANTLSLIDDEAVNKQLEVGHLVQRLRDACDENLGRLNIMIAQMHGDPEVHERENPYRPYLIARALYDTLKDKVSDEEVAKILFDHLSNSLANRLSDYYAAICEVFEESGIQARLLARPSKLKRHQRDQLAQQLASLKSTSSLNVLGGSSPAPESGPELSARVLPVLERMANLFGRYGEAESGSGGMGGAASGQRGGGPGGEMAAGFEDYVWKLFNAEKGAGGRMALDSGAAEEATAIGGEAAAPSAASPELLTRLDQFQRLAADDKPIDESAAAASNQLFAVNDKLAPSDATQEERIAIDVIAVLFEFILEDEQIPAGMRLLIGRLQIPFLKAAMLAPELLRDGDHPARKLLNRMSSAVVGLDSTTPIGKSIGEEIARLVKRILQDFDKDTGIFLDCLEQLERFLDEQLRNVSSDTAGSVQALEEVEEVSLLAHHTSASLHAMLEPLRVDARVADFITRIWTKVLVRAATQGGGTAGEQYRDVLPELVWSAQEKQTPQDRQALIKLLPGLVKRLKIGMLMVHMSEDECKEALDRLVEVHTQILRATPSADAGGALPSLEDLRREFSRLVIDRASAAWTLTRPVPIQQELVSSALADRGVEAEVEVAPQTTLQDSEAQTLSLIELGTCVEFWAADTSVPARAIWVSKHKSLFIFKMDQHTKPLVYSAVSLVKALREGAIRLVEYAPAFDRAVDALMMETEAVQARRQ